MLNILIAGGDGMLDISLTARFLSTGNQVFYSASSDDCLLRQQILQAASQYGNSLLYWSVLGQNAPEVQFDQIWYCRGSRPAEEAIAELRTLLCSGRLKTATQLNDVDTGFTGAPAVGDSSQRQANGEPSTHGFEKFCAAQNVSCRIFQLCAIIGDVWSAQASANHPLLHFLATLDGLKHEIEERFPDYFEFQGLRFLAPGGARLKVLHADDAVERMVETPWHNSGACSRYSLTAAQDFSLDQLCLRIGRAYDLNVFSVAKTERLNAVDRLFQARLGSFASFVASDQQRDGNDAREIETISHPGSQFSESAQPALFRRIRQSQDVSRNAAARCIASLATTMQQKTLDRDGSPLTYSVAGSGPDTIIMINALGQGLDFWYRLIHVLHRGYRVIIWSLRGTVAPSGPFRIADQVKDVEAILQAEKITACHLLAWCSGVKVAVEFYLRHPSAVLSIVFLNGAFKCLGGQRELDTAFEHNLESLFRVLDRRPAIAPSVMEAVRDSLLRESLEEPEQMESEQLAVATLARINQTLKPHLLPEFQNEATTVNYARQVLDFWSYDSAVGAPVLNVPVLLVTSEYDRIASPEWAKNTAQLLPRVRHVHLQGATHYFLYDSPDLAARLIQNFLQGVEALPPDPVPKNPGHNKTPCL